MDQNTLSLVERGLGWKQPCYAILDIQKWEKLEDNLFF